MSTPAAPNPTPPTPTPLPPAQPTLSGLTLSALGLVIGLVWGTLMMLVFGFWMRAKYGGTGAITPNIFFVAAALAAGAAAWQAFTLWFKKESPEQKLMTLSQQRQIFSYVLMGAGLGLIVLAFVLGAKTTGGNYRFGIENFAETIGALLFGLIALGSGYVLQIAPSDEAANPVRFLVGKVPVLKVAMIAIGVAALGAFIYLSFMRKIGFEWLPELTALLMMSVLAAGCMFWLNSGEMDDDGVRLFVLVFGGVTGLILFFLSLGRAFLWRDEIFGIAAWQGESAWRFWLCAYLLFTSLVLMFLSFNLARADIRTSVNLRRLMYGYDAIAQALLLIGILFELNVVIYAMVPFTYDWTKTRGTHALSESSKRLIGGLKKETNVVVLLPQNHMGYKDLRNLLDNCQALSNKLKVQYINPDSEFTDYENLAKKFRQILPDVRTGQPGRGVLLVNGPIPDKDEHNTPYSFVPDRKIIEVDRGMGPEGEKPKILFKGESEIMKELKFLLQDRTKRKIYVLQDNDEPSISKNEPTQRLEFKNGFAEVGLGGFVDKLQKDNYDVTGLSFKAELPTQKPQNVVHVKEDPVTKRKEVPADCHTLIIAGSSKSIPNDVIKAIHDYADRGGKLLVMLDVFANNEYTKYKDTGLESMLSKFAVDVSEEFPLRLMENRNDNPSVHFATPNLEATNPLPRAFPSDEIILFRGARIVQPSKAPGRFKAETLLQLDSRHWPVITEKNINVLKDPQNHVWTLMKDVRRTERSIAGQPLSVAVAVTDTTGDKPCMVVFGDTEFVTNREIRISKTHEQAYAFVVSSLEWMAERESFGGQPKVTSTFELPKRAVDIAGRMIMIPFWLMTLFVIGLGVSVWVVRRR